MSASVCMAKMSSAVGDNAFLRAAPALVLDLPALEFGAAGAVEILVVEDEVEDEGVVHVGAAEIQAGPHHADLIAHLEAAPPGEEVGPLAVAGQFVGEGVVDDDGFAARIDQALS